MASTYLYRTNSQSYNRKTWTFSAWIKRSYIGGNNTHLYATDTAANNFSRIYINGSNHLCYYDADGGSTACYLETNRVLRDLNGWYHVMIVLDTTQSTADNRIKMYINGVQETSFAYRTNPSQNADLRMNINTQHNLGKNGNNQTAECWDGYMSHVHFIDGTAYDASAFGSTDSTTGEWKINTSPSVTYGTNGWFILKDGNSGTDQSTNSNNYTVSGTLTKSEDCPSNVFATWNPLINPWAGNTVWYNGGTTVTNPDNTNKAAVATTLGATSGKYYFEIKKVNANNEWIGVCSDKFVSDNHLNAYSGQSQNITNGMVLRAPDGTGNINGTQTNNAYASFTGGDIIGIALNLDAATKTVTFYKNGTVDSAGAVNLPTNMQTGAVFGCALVYGNSQVNLNAGNGYFATTVVSSAGTNASGIGIFEYDVPANHTALSTKGLNL